MDESWIAHGRLPEDYRRASPSTVGNIWSASLPQRGMLCIWVGLPTVEIRLQLTGRASVVATWAVRRFVATLLLFAWIACYAQCVGRSCGVEAGDDCCEQSQQVGQETGKTKESGKPCVCEAFKAGGVDVSQPSLLLDAMLSAVVVITLCAAVAFFIPIPRLLEAVHGDASRWRSWKAVPRRTVPLWQILVRTALPVRGPSLVAI